MNIKIGFYTGDVLKLVSEDIPTLKPEIFPSVPRIYNRIYGKIKEGIESQSSCKKWLIDRALRAKLANLEVTGSVAHPCYDLLIFNKFKAIFGGNLRIMMTGSAPINPDVMKFLKVCFSSEMIEGYGMTETSAASCTRISGDTTYGHVGGPNAGILMKLRDVPEMGYFHSNTPPQGEICFYGP